MSSRPFAILTAMGALALPFVASAQTKPVLTENVDEPGRNPFQKVVNGPARSPFIELNVFTVPSGRRLVVQQFSALIYTGGPMIGIAGIECRGIGQTQGYVYVPFPTVTLVTETVAVPSSLTNLYCDAGNTIVFTVQLSGTPSSTFPMGATVTGYLVNVP